MAKRKSDEISGFVWIALGVGLCVESIRLGFGTIRSPGSGFAPFIIGTLLGLLGIALIISLHLEGSAQKEETAHTPTVKGSRKGFLALAFLFAYAFLLETLGFIVGTCFLLICLFKMMQPGKWFQAIAISAVTVALSYLMFHVWLRLNLPTGIFRIG